MNKESWLGLIVALLFFIDWRLDPVATRHVTELSCKGDLDPKTMACKQVDSVVTNMVIMINVNTGKVRLSSNQGTNDIMTCDVVDGDNWKCKDTAGTMTLTEAMQDGIYTSSLETQFSGNLYYSSLTGIPYWLYHYGIVDLKTAISWE